MSNQFSTQTVSTNLAFAFAEVAALLQIPAEQLQHLCRVFAAFLGPQASAADARYSHGDLATLITIQRLQENGLGVDQIAQRLSTKSVPGVLSPATPPLPPTISPAISPGDHALAAWRNGETSETGPLPPQAVHAMIHTVAQSQQSMLNVQESVKEMLGVVVQDNFNLKHENRKLRERMLELERTLAEYQRREETRKEKLEGRLRALEGTLGAMQQQLAQLVQAYRQRERRGWFW